MSTLGALPTRPSTVITGTAQGKDVEANASPPVAQPGARNRIPWTKVYDTMVLVGIYVAILVTCCLIFFSSVAIGHVLFLHSKKAVHPKPDGRDEYISSVLASGLFLLIMTGPFFLTDILSSDWDYDDYCGPWTILACSLLILGPACIALSSEILRVTHMVVVTVKEVVLHYTVGYLVILGAVVLWIVIVASWGN